MMTQILSSLNFTSQNKAKNSFIDRSAAVFAIKKCVKVTELVFSNSAKSSQQTLFFFFLSENN